jgi:hypothetical protein
MYRTDIIDIERNEIANCDRTGIVVQVFMYTGHFHADLYRIGRDDTAKPVLTGMSNECFAKCPINFDLRTEEGREELKRQFQKYIRDGNINHLKYNTEISDYVAFEDL